MVEQARATRDANHVPAEITLHQGSRVLELSYANGSTVRLPCEFLRVYSPSAEVRGHGPGQEVLQRGKRDVGVRAVEPVGNYAVRLVFTDGHDSGIFSWDYLHAIGRDQDALWRQYLQRLEREGGSRDPEAAVKPHQHTVRFYKPS